MWTRGVSVKLMHDAIGMGTRTHDVRVNGMHGANAKLMLSASRDVGLCGDAGYCRVQDRRYAPAYP
jgi:hypothetical protein